MRLKYFLITFLLVICLSPLKANDALINTKDTNDISAIIKNSLEFNLNTHNKTKLLTPEEVEKLASNFVDRLYSFFTSTSEELDIKELEYLTKTLKTNIINLVLPNQVNFIHFINTQ